MDAQRYAMFFLVSGVVRKRTEGRKGHTGLAYQINVHPPFLITLIKALRNFAIPWRTFAKPLTPALLTKHPLPKTQSTFAFSFVV